MTATEIKKAKSELNLLLTFVTWRREENIKMLIIFFSVKCCFKYLEDGERAHKNNSKKVERRRRMR